MKLNRKRQHPDWFRILHLTFSIFLLFVFSGINLYAQNSKSFTQRIEWEEDDNAFEYKVELRSIGSDVFLEGQESDVSKVKGTAGKSNYYTTEDSWLDLKLGAGNYEYRVYAYDFLGRQASVSDWQRFSIIKAVKPVIEDLKQNVVVSESNQITFDVPVDVSSITKDTRVELVNAKNGRRIKGELSVQTEDGRLVASKAVFPEVPEGSWKAVITNPSGMFSESPVIEVAKTKESARKIVAADKTKIYIDPDAERLAEEARIAEERRLAEEARIAEEKRKAEEARIAEERRLAEEARIAEEKRKAEEARIAEERRLAEEARIAEERRLAEEARIAEERRLAEEARIAEEKRLAEEARIAEEKRLAEEARIAEERRLAEEARIAEEKRKAEEARIAEEKRLAEEARIAEEKRLAEEARIAEEKRKAEEARIAEERRLAEEARIAEERRKAEEARIAEEKRLAEEARIAEERRLAEEARIAEERRLAEEARIAEERRLAEEARIAEENAARILAELLRIQQEEEQARIAEEKRLAEEVRIAEEKRLAEEARIAEERRILEEARIEEQKRIQEEKELLAQQRRNAPAKDINLGAGINFIYSPYDGQLYTLQQLFTGYPLYFAGSLKTSWLPFKIKDNKLGGALQVQGTNITVNNDYLTMNVPVITAKLNAEFQLNLIKDKLYLDVHGGAGTVFLGDMVSYKEESLRPAPEDSFYGFMTAQVGAGIYWLPAKHFAIETGLDFTHYFIPDMPTGLLEPYVILCLRL